jgi:hypothetical protein
MRTLRKIWHTWQQFGQMMGDFIARVLLTIFYFTILAPFGIGVRLLADPLTLKQKVNPQWLERTARDPVLAQARRTA